MRWSLILSTSLTVLSTLSIALVIPSESSIDLERRAGGAKSSYRKNSENHDYAYKFDQSGAVTREKLKSSDRSINGKKIPNTDADHVFEHQMLDNHLKKHGLHYRGLLSELQDKEHILNGSPNMVPVPARVNRGKGQVIKHGLEGKAFKPNESRDKYTLLSYGTAKKTAKKLDKAFEEHGHNFGDKTFHNTLRNTMNNAKIMKPKDSSPASSKASDHGSSKASSDTGSGKASPRKSFVVGNLGSKAKPQVLPIRSSARIAERKAKEPEK